MDLAPYRPAPRINVVDTERPDNPKLRPFKALVGGKPLAARNGRPRFYKHASAAWDAAYDEALRRMAAEGGTQ